MIIEDQLTTPCPQTYKSLKFSRTLHSADTHSMIITMRLNRDEEDKDLWLRVR